MEVKKCYIACLTLFGLVAPLCLTSLDVSALKHDYTGFQFKSVEIALPSYDSVNDEKYFDSTNWSTTAETTYIGGGFEIQFKGGASGQNIEIDRSYSDMMSSFNNNSCEYSSLKAQFYSHDDIITTSSSYPLLSSDFTVDNYLTRCRSNGEFGDENASFKESSLSSYLMPCTGFSSDGNGCYNSTHILDSYVKNNLLPYPYTANGFKRVSKAIDDTTGVHYSHVFSFDDLFNKPVSKFSKLVLPLGTYDDYFYNKNNLWSGRNFKWQGVFEFDQPLTFNPNLSQNSYFQVITQGLKLNTTSMNLVSQSTNCSVNYRSVEASNYYALEYTCDLTLETDYLTLTPRLIISGADDYVFETSGDWRFASFFLVTDNDDTPGYDFNNDINGKYVPGDASNYIPTDDNTDWFDSLLNLFHIDIINPFTPIFLMFTDQSSCAQIPILSSMLHSEETQVCPMFDSSTRAILTPVLSIVSMMIIFGFAVHWLGGRSGNLIEDSTGDHSFHIGTRQKGGKK